MRHVFGVYQQNNEMVRSTRTSRPFYGSDRMCHDRFTPLVRFLRPIVSDDAEIAHLAESMELNRVNITILGIDIPVSLGTKLACGTGQRRWKNLPPTVGFQC
jgi:hypothetical protein